MDRNIVVTKIQRFCLHDGPGIRTTVFLKGCNLKCPWCANPENISADRQIVYNGNSSVAYGSFYEPRELVIECTKDIAFYGGKNENSSNWKIRTSSELNRLPGGVTFSGGECLLQMEKLVPVCEMLHGQNVHIAAETNLFASSTLLDIALRNIDLFYVDIKILNQHRCAEVENGDLNVFYANLDRLISTEIPVIVRVPVIGTYTDGLDNREAVKRLIESKKNGIIKIELLKEHNLGKSKYCSLGKKVDYHGVSDSLMEEYKMELMELGIPVEICIA